MLPEHTVITSYGPENSSAALCAVDTSLLHRRDHQTSLNPIKRVKATLQIGKRKCNLIIGVSYKPTACRHKLRWKSTLHLRKCKWG